MVENMARHKHLKFIGIHFIVQKGICFIFFSLLPLYSSNFFSSVDSAGMVNLKANQIFKMNKKSERKRTNGVENIYDKTNIKSVKCICVCVWVTVEIP